MEGKNLHYSLSSKFFNVKRQLDMLTENLYLINITYKNNISQTILARQTIIIKNFKLTRKRLHKNNTFLTKVM